MGLRKKSATTDAIAKSASAKSTTVKTAGKTTVKTVKANQILIGECIDELHKMPHACIDLIFADPPYNLQLENELLRPNNSRVDGVDQNWDKFSDISSP